MTNIHFITIIACLIISVVSFFLLTHIEYYSIPNSDIFQYIEDGQKYIKGTLPENIHAPPGNPLLLTILSKFIDHQRKEIIAAILINNVSVIGILFLLYFLVHNLLPHYALPIILMICMSPLLYVVGLDITSEALFTLLCLGSLFARYKRKVLLSSIVAGLSFFVRYEAIALIGSYVIVDIFRRNKNDSTKNLAGIIIALIWIYVINTHNPHGNLSGNTFLQEIQEGWVGIRTLAFAKRITSLTPFLGPAALHQYVLFPLLIVIHIKTLLHRHHFYHYISLYSLLYIGIHTIFPAVIDRYLLPLIWVIPLLISLTIQDTVSSLKNKHQIISASILYYTYILLFVGNSIWHAPGILIKLQSIKYSHHEYRLLANWLNETTFTHPVQVLVLEPWMLRYYVNNQQVSVPNIPQSAVAACSSIECLISYLQIKEPQKSIILITDSYTSHPYSLNDYWPIKFGIRLYNDFENRTDKKGYQTLTRIEENTSFFSAYKYLENN